MTVKEDFLYYLWKFGKLHVQNLQTSAKETIQIINLGTHNHHAGPDFFNAQLRIGTQLWAGNVEMHVNASDWFVHHHEKDKNYDNVILHVVWNYDMDVHRKNNAVIPTLVLKDFTDFTKIQRYNTLMHSPNKWIHCEADFPVLHDFQLQNWLERLYLERLEKKSVEIEAIVETTNYDWEAVLFRLLAKGFGLKLNSEAFFEAASSVNFSTIRKLSAKHQSLEAFLFGIFGLLSQDVSQEKYYDQLKSVFWETHYTFEKISPKRKKILSKRFIDVLLINTIIPLKYCYERYLGKSNIENILVLLRSIAPEKNTIIQKFATKNITIENALQTQALLELKKNYCDTHQCLQCALGNSL